MIEEIVPGQLALVSRVPQDDPDQEPVERLEIVPGFVRDFEVLVENLDGHEVYCTLRMASVSTVAHKPGIEEGTVRCFCSSLRCSSFASDLSGVCGTSVEPPGVRGTSVEPPGVRGTSSGSFCSFG